VGQLGVSCHTDVVEIKQQWAKIMSSPRNLVAAMPENKTKKLDNWVLNVKEYCFTYKFATKY
jgi:hypothetical protein